MHAVIMAGGVGTRFWPRSRRARPKQLLPIAGPASMIRMTVDRLRPLVPSERIWVVTGAEQAAGIRRELPELPANHVLVEPCGRNTAPCIGLAAAVLRAEGAGPDERMMVLASDHVIRDEAEFRSVLAACDAHLAERDRLLTLGIRPTRPETGYGYIRRGDAREEFAARGFHVVDRFVEKPDAATAERLVGDGRHAWNSGMFVWRVERILDELRRHLPEVGMGMDELGRAWGTPAWEARLAAAYPGFPSISIDYAVMEKAADVWMTDVDLGWSDVGSWASLQELRPGDGDGNVLPEASLAVESRSNIVEVRGKTVVLLGVSDLIVVEEDDALLICHRDRAQQVGQVPQRLRQAGKESLT
jgi:mannose-1-phosphate guanylyltransferase